MRSWFSFPILRIPFFFLIGLVFLPVVRGQEVVLHLKNGDRLTGKIVQEQDSILILENSVLGKITVPVDEISRREAAKVEEAISEKEVSDQTVTAGPPATVAPPPAEEVLPPPPKVPWKTFLENWSGEAQLGANVSFSSKDRQTYTGRMKAAHISGPLKNQLDYNFTYGRTEGILSDNRMDGSWKLEYGLGNRFLVYNAVGAGYDQVREIDFQFDVGPGVGYKLINRDNLRLRIESGGNYQQQYLAEDKARERYSMRLAQNLFWNITSKFRLEEKIDFFPEMTDLGEYRIRFEVDFQYLLFKNLTLTLNLIDLYDTDVPKGVSHNDLQIRSLIGVKF